MSMNTDRQFQDVGAPSLPLRTRSSNCSDDGKPSPRHTSFRSRCVAPRDERPRRTFGWYQGRQRRFRIASSPLDNGCCRVLASGMPEHRLMTAGKIGSVPSRPRFAGRRLADLPPGLDPAKMAEGARRNACMRREGTRNLVAVALAASKHRPVPHSVVALRGE